MDLCGPMRIKDEAPDMIIKTRKIKETIHVKFVELTAMDFECNNLEPGQNRLIFQYLSEESSQTLTKEDLDDLFGPLYEEYYEMRNPEESTDSAAPNTLNKEDTPPSSTLVVDDNEAPQIVSTSKEPPSQSQMILLMNQFKKIMQNLTKILS
ncbi:hypothetical protein Tco_0246180 [Tanacetum coccineum]